MCAQREITNHNIFNVRYDEINPVQGMLYGYFPNLTQKIWKSKSGKTFDLIVIENHVDDVDELVDYYSNPEHYNDLIDDAFQLDDDIETKNYREWNLNYRIRYVAIRLIMVYNSNTFVPPYDLLVGVDASSDQFYNSAYDINAPYNNFLFDMFEYKLLNTIYGEDRKDEVNPYEVNVYQWYKFWVRYNNNNHSIWIGRIYDNLGRTSFMSQPKLALREIYNLMSGEKRENIVPDVPNLKKRSSYEWLDVDNSEPVLPLITRIWLEHGLPSQYEIDYSDYSDDTSEDYSIKRNPRSKFETVRQGELFIYDFKISNIPKPLQNDVKNLMCRYQIFTEFDNRRHEYKYNCLLYAMFRFICEDLTIEWDKRLPLACQVCNNLLYEINSRVVSSRDIIKINEWLKNHGYNYYLQLYETQNRGKIEPINDKKTKSKVTNDGLTPIPIIILNSEEFDGLTINHYILYEYIDINEEIEKWIKSLVTNDNDLGYHNGFIQDHQINSYRLLNFLFHVKNQDNNSKLFFERWSNRQIDMMTEIKNIEMKDANTTLNLIRSLDRKTCENSHKIYFDNKNRPHEKKFKFSHIVFADFEADTTYQVKNQIGTNDTTHKPYCISWVDKNHRRVHHSTIKTDVNGNLVFNPNKIFEKLKDMTLIYFHNSSYDIRMFDYSDPLLKIEDVVERGANSYCRNVEYGEGDNIKHFRIVDSYKMISSGLAKFKGMFGFEEEYEKEVFPYNYYTYNQFEKVKDNSFIVNMYNINESEFNSTSDYEQFKNNIRRLYSSDEFDLRDYAKYYCNRDVQVLKQGMIAFQKSIKEITNLDIFSFFTLPALANKAFEENVYSKTPDGHTTYKYMGIVREYIQQSIYGGICTSLEGKKWLIMKLLTDFDAVSLYPSAMKRLYVVTGKCKVFTSDEIRWINEHPDCLIDISNDEDENDPSKLNAFIVTIKITSSRPSKMSRIIVKNELINGQLVYPHLPPGNNCVVVNPDFDLNDPKYNNISLEDDDRYYTVKEAIVTINDITFSDYITYYDMEYEVLGGIYWKNSPDNPSTKLYDVREYIQSLFDDRLKYQKQGNTGMATAIKLLMNSAYGKSIQNAIDTKTTYVKNKRVYTNDGTCMEDLNKLEKAKKSQWKQQLNKGIISQEDYDYKCANFKKTTLYNDLVSDFIGAKQCNIKDIIAVTEDLYRFETTENTLDYASNTLFGSHLLSMSKRIMMEVITTAEDNDVNVYYQDTDSMHIEADKVELLANAFRERYERELIGKQLGQFHSDFDTFELSDCLKLCDLPYEERSKYSFDLSQPLATNGIYVFRNGKLVKNNSFTVSSMCIINGKKCYLDVLTNGDQAFGNTLTDVQFKSKNNWNGKQNGILTNKKVQYHVRAKGVNAKAIYNYVKTNKLNSIVDVYTGLLNDKTFTFDISSAITTFKMNNNQHVNTVKLTRKLQFKNPEFRQDNNDEKYITVE